jgi:hypothetical protein
MVGPLFRRSALQGRPVVAVGRRVRCRMDFREEMKTKKTCICPQLG